MTTGLRSRLDERPVAGQYNNDDVNLAAQQINDILVAQPDLTTLVAVGGWAQYAPAAYSKAINMVKDRVDSKQLYISMGDTFAPQMPLLKQSALIKYCVR